MPFTDYARALLELAEVINRWFATLTPLDRARRNRVARYAAEIADTLARAADALHALEADPRRAVIREPTRARAGRARARVAGDAGAGDR